MIKTDCFKIMDYTKSASQTQIINCAQKYYPQFLLRYGKQSINACACFSKHIIPNWKNRYQKYANDYVEEFKVIE